VESAAEVDESVVMHGTEIGPRAVVRRAILDKNVVVHAGARIGLDPEEDRSRGFVVTPGGVTVVGKGEHVLP
jgi:glucose-1-phosphate adenylyltransferase